MTDDQTVLISDPSRVHVKTSGVVQARPSWCSSCAARILVDLVASLQSVNSNRRWLNSRSSDCK